ncbi:oligosaccharide repeat unit polymerase family protein [Methanobrevibacter sp. DSM 116169]|uniref:oligosaccharide repeat unit polymerase family protein n=1 Tax=Methanobrevibacter sp. DSM 116169 TaxID=3242727 RepID=UPI0038FCB385
MSYLYLKISSILNCTIKKVKNSFLFTLIFNILHFIEDQFVNSYFKRLYPSENFLSFLKKSKILNNYIFSPLIVLVVFAFFLILSINPISKSLTINLFLAFISFFIGAIILPKLFLNKDIKLPSFKLDDIYSIGFCLILIGIIFFIISIASVGGLPILKPSLRYLLRPILTMPVFLMIPGICLIGAVYLEKYKNNLITRSQVRFRFLILLILSSVILLTLGYRTPLIAVILIIIIMGYYGKILAVWEVIIGALISVGLIIGIGYFRSLGEYTIGSATDPFYSLKSRADFTLHVLDLLNAISGDFGLTHGKLLASSIPGSELGPRMIVGKLIAWRTEVTVTPTLIGQMLVDFGRIGVIAGMSLLGFILGIGFKIIRKTKNYFFIGLYSLIISYAIVGVETGILDIQVIFYYIIAILIYLIVIIKNK